MNTLDNTTPTYLFEVSWEICNKVGGIHTVISTKAISLVNEYKNNYILIGPDVWRYNEANPEFIEEPHLLKSWKTKAAQEGLKVKIGRWNVAGNPIVILVDFTPFIPQKDQILTSFWDVYKLDSLTGQWDYIEPTLFGYASAKVIESFVNYNTSSRQKVIAQFHEWMTGSGLLYIKHKLPQVGCVFTTHATVLGRSIAGNGWPLYGKLSDYNPIDTARNFNVGSKQSMESLSAQYADCFTTVSEITAVECAHFLGKKPDIITPNGFENVFTPPEKEYANKRKEGRSKLLQVAQAILAKPLPEDPLIIGISGRYEFKNKGLDVFIDALAKINNENNTTREIFAFILVPAGHKDPNPEVLNNMLKPYQASDNHNPFLTHELSDPEHDLVLKNINEKGLTNKTEDKVKVFFSPCYLNGNDGIFNMPYYDLLIGMDLTVFPSYYEPWGYTPLESLAFKVPTITTTLAGFGLWVQKYCKEKHTGIEVIERNDDNSDFVTQSISEKIVDLTTLNSKEYQLLQQNSKDISDIALWENLILYYQKAYNIAIEKVEARIESIPTVINEDLSFINKKVVTNRPNWMSIIVHKDLPVSLKGLEELSKNLWWSWNSEAKELFKSIDPALWKTVERNPIALLDKLSLNRYRELVNDDDFMQRLENVYSNYKNYMDRKNEMNGPSIAYFSMEYGLDSSLKIYSGGLGVLAGDYLKEASDKKTKITGIGLLYRYGYFTQKFSGSGNQEAYYEAQDFSKIPITPATDMDGNALYITLPLPGRTLHAKIWKVEVGLVELYLLDADIQENSVEDRSITYYLYGGDWENRLKQELLLGCGGIQALRKLNISADIYHCNEGHAAFIGLERLAEYIETGHMAFSEAMEVVRASSLFTTHTPVPAGHDSFLESVLKNYLSEYPERLKISWEQLVALGKINPNDPNEKFSMSFLAANLSQEINGVSWLHGKVSRQIFKDLWPGYLPEELHIDYVTNGVHYPTWIAAEWQRVHGNAFCDKFQSHDYGDECFEGIYDVPDDKIMEVRNDLRKELMKFIKSKLDEDKNSGYFTPKEIVEIQENLKDDILTIGFARRFATYKRAYLLFSNLERLDQIVNNPERPVQFIFAGKAHPADQAGQNLIKRIVEISKYPQFLGKILFIPNYDMFLARKMIQGVDVWMNTPTRPQEASGTSGEKAVMNGVMHFSVLDGWWVEGYREDAGWALPAERAYENQDFQDELDAEMIYNIIEDKIAPAFYEKDEKNISPKWVWYIKNTIAKVAVNFTSNRMLSDYEVKFYHPMNQRYHRLIENNFAVAAQIAAWKKKIRHEWENIQVISLSIPDKSKQVISLGKSYKCEVTLDIGELSIDDVGVELVITEKELEKIEVHSTYEFFTKSFDHGKAIYHLEVIPDNPGTFMLGVRIYPKNPLLPHRQDFSLVKWL